MTKFVQDVFAVVKKIKAGTTLSYKQVAILSGHPRAYRAVGSVLKKNYETCIPCHRVVRSDGTIGQYNRGIQKKLDLLKQEGAVK